MVFKVFCVPSYHPHLTSSWSNVLLNHSTALRDGATDIEKISQKGAPEREQPNRSAVKTPINTFIIMLLIFLRSQLMIS